MRSIDEHYHCKCGGVLKEMFKKPWDLNFGVRTVYDCEKCTRIAIRSSSYGFFYFRPQFRWIKT